jgi:hypothetical protein
MGAVSELPESLRIPIPQGLVTKISARPSPSKSATGLNLLSAVFNNHPPNLVPFGAIMGAVSELPESLRIPIPQGLVTKISARPSPSKSQLRRDIIYTKKLLFIFSVKPQASVCISIGELLFMRIL